MKRPASGEKQPRARSRAGARSAPRSSIRSTFIAGFPGETEAEFEHLLDFLREARDRPRRLLRLLAGRRRRAPTRCPGMLPSEVREERRARFMAVAEAVVDREAAARASARRCRCWSIRRPASAARAACGRSYADAPEIDGRVRLLPPEKASKTLKVGEFTRARIVAARGPRPGRACRSDVTPMATTRSDPPTQHLADPPRLPAAGRLRRGAAGGAQGVDGDLRRTSPRCARATGRRRPATPTACTARRPPSCSRSASPRSKAALQTLLAPSGLAAITLVDMALLKSGDEVLHSRQRLRPEQGAGAQRAGALGHRASLLRPDGSPSRCAPRFGRAHAPGLARGAGLGDDGVSRPAGAGAASRASAA